ncbi:MAG: MotA/TolQ/ExbB proton channel family protein [Verrucomicrobiota bacterium]|nr:MotA/TolQ/ExbB proton channel family protein [Verrucomicrobiota bacterium]
MPEIIQQGGPVMWLLAMASASALFVFLERLIHYHRSQINSMEFLNGVRNVLKRDNIVEAISICEATPGPVARLAKSALIHRDHGKEGVREALEEAGLMEVPRLEEKLNLLATVAQIAPLIGLLGTSLGMMDTFRHIADAGLYAKIPELAAGIWQALICTAGGIAVAIPSYAAYNYLVSRVNSIVLDMEKASAEIISMVHESISSTEETQA